MRNLAALAGIAVLGLSAQTAFGYGGTASLTFDFGGSASGADADQGWTSAAGSVAISSMSNSTVFSGLSGANTLGTYNSDFASAGDCAAGGAYVPASGTAIVVRKYGCRYNSTGGTPLFVGTTVADGGPIGRASGSLTVTDTSLFGTLTIVATTDEPTGASTTFAGGTRISNSVGDGTTGYNYRTADGSPFGNAWYGVTTLGTLNVNLTGTFNSSSWSITGGSVTFTDAGFACQQGGFGGATQGTLCTASTTGGGFNPNGDHLSWGMDVDASGTGSTTAGMIDVRNAAGSATVASLAGAIASLTVSGNSISGGGEYRRASGSAGGGCLNHIRYDTTSGLLTCGSLVAGGLAISGDVSNVLVPVPAAVWLMGSALGLLGWIRRKVAA